MALIRLRDVDVEIPIYDGKSRSLKGVAARTATRGRVGRRDHGIVTVHALRSINMELTDGDRVGLIGRNGSGKSTLLRVLAGVYHPTRGSLDVVGELSALLSLTNAMDMEASGRENIILQGLAMGMSRRHLTDRMDEIIEFTELGDHIDLPVRTYSSGMQLRLAFAIATSKSSDIMLIDEVIGVGDFEFVEKARKRMDELMGSARILVIASHDDHVLKSTCDKGMVLDGGRIVHYGPIEEALGHYHGM